MSALALWHIRCALTKSNLRNRQATSLCHTSRRFSKQIRRKDVNYAIAD